MRKTTAWYISTAQWVSHSQEVVKPTACTKISHSIPCCGNLTQGSKPTASHAVGFAFHVFFHSIPMLWESHSRVKTHSITCCGNRVPRVFPQHPMLWFLHTQWMSGNHARSRARGCLGLQLHEYLCFPTCAVGIHVTRHGLPFFRATRERVAVKTHSMGCCGNHP